MRNLSKMDFLSSQHKLSVDCILELRIEGHHKIPWYKILELFAMDLHIHRLGPLEEHKPVQRCWTQKHPTFLDHFEESSKDQMKLQDPKVRHLFPVAVNRSEPHLLHSKSHWRSVIRLMTERALSSRPEQRRRHRSTSYVWNEWA